MTAMVGIDVGGTFTDVILYDRASGQVSTSKVPSTPADQSDGLTRGLVDARDGEHADAALIHSTTVALNAMIERRGSRCGLIATAGFRDILELGRRDRPSVYGFSGAFVPLIAREDRYEVDGRIAFDGEVIEELDLEAVRAAGREMLESGVDNVAICFVNSYANPEHELAARAALAEIWPDERLLVTSSELFPEVGEFERFATCAANAYLQPVMQRYLGRLSQRLGDSGFTGSVHVMQSNGGITSLDEAGRVVVNTVKSGPAAGVIAGAEIGRLAGHPDVITCDMGGTSFDVSLIPAGEPTVSNDLELGFRQPLLSSAIDVVAVGAGGGSIAWLDRAGVLTVGPRSAGAVPGPACYGHGGTEPTVTDANLVLGRIDTSDPLGNGTDLRLDASLAEEAVRRVIAEPLGIGVEEAATAILDVVTSNMANAIRTVSVERGHDPRDFALVPIGGAGPLHVCALLEEMEIPVGLVPPLPGLSCALGCLAARLRFETSQTHACTVAALEQPAERERLAAVFTAQEEELRERLDQARTEVSGTATIREADMQYEGQGPGSTLRVKLDDLAPEAIASAFEATYAERYGKAYKRGVPQILTVRSTLEATHDEVDFEALWREKVARAPERPRRTTTMVVEGKPVEAPVVPRWSLDAGDRIEGPALVVQEDSTCFLDRGYAAEVDRFGNLLVRRENEGGQR